MAKTKAKAEETKAEPEPTKAKPRGKRKAEEEAAPKIDQPPPIDPPKAAKARPPKGKAGKAAPPDDEG